MKYTVTHLSNVKFNKVTQIITIILEGAEKYKLQVAFMCLWGCVEEFMIPEYSNYWKGNTKQKFKLDMELIDNIDKRIYSIIDL